MVFDHKYRRGVYGELVYIDPVVEGHLYEEEIRKNWGEKLAQQYRDCGLEIERLRKARGEKPLNDPIKGFLTVFPALEEAVRERRPTQEKPVPAIAIGETTAETLPEGGSTSTSPTSASKKKQETERIVGVIVKCVNCHLTGHVGARWPFGDNRVCGHCCQLGHVERDCPDKHSPPPGETEAKILRMKNEDEILRRISRREASYEDLARARARHYNI